MSIDKIVAYEKNRIKFIQLLEKRKGIQVSNDQWGDIFWRFMRLRKSGYFHKKKGISI